MTPPPKKRPGYVPGQDCLNEILFEYLPMSSAIGSRYFIRKSATNSRFDLDTHNVNYEDVCLYISEGVKGNY